MKRSIIYNLLFLFFCFSFGFVVKAETLDIETVLDNMDKSLFGLVMKDEYTVDYNTTESKIIFTYKKDSKQMILEVDGDSVIYSNPKITKNITLSDYNNYKQDVIMLNNFVCSLFYSNDLKNVEPNADFYNNIDEHGFKINSYEFSFENDDMDVSGVLVSYAKLSLDTDNISYIANKYTEENDFDIEEFQGNEEYLEILKMFTFEDFSDHIKMSVDPLEEDSSFDESDEEDDNRGEAENLGASSIVGYVLIFMAFIVLFNILKTKRMYNKI